MKSLFARKIRSAPIPTLLVLLAFALASGCATPPVLHYSNFLPDYGRMQVSAERPDSAMWRKPSTSFSNYKKVMVDEPVIYTPAEAKNSLDPDLRARLVKEMRAAVEEKLGNSFLIVKEPGPDTLRVRVAMTEVFPTGSLSESPTEDRVPVTFKDSHLESEVLDALTADTLLTMVDSRRGRNFMIVQNRVRWEDVRKLTREWAENLRQSLTKNP